MDTLLVKPESEEQMKTVKAILKALNVDFTFKKDKPYDKEFVKKIQESRQQAKEGKTTKIKLEDLWK